MKLKLARILATVAALVLAGSLTGCVTYRQVKQIVADSNTAMLAHQLNGDGDAVITADGTKSDNDLESAAARIESFIAEHPDQKTTAAALRIRQAMLFLTAGKPELGRAAFNAADTNFLFTARDQTLAAMAPYLVWWFSASGKDANWGESDRDTKAPAALAKLRELQLSLTTSLALHPENDGIRDYVAETRAWIGLKKTLSHGDLNAARLAFEDTVSFYYTNALTTSDVTLLKCHCRCADTPAAPKTLPPAIRRCFRTEVLFGYAKKVWDEKARAGAFQPVLPEDLKQRIQSATPGP